MAQGSRAAAPLTRQLEASGPYAPGGEGEYRVAREVWYLYRRQQGYKGYAPILTPPASNVKLAKTKTPVYGLTLSPADASGKWNTCLWATPECRAACVLQTAGKGVLASVQRARVVRTGFLAEHPAHAVALIAGELRAAVARHGRVVARLNVASDLRWERIAPDLLTLPGVTFYDYTKAPAGQREPSDTYRLTYSLSERESSEREGERYVASGGTAAVVLAVKRGQPLPLTWRGRPVIDGDASDDRTQDPEGVYVGLRAKGAAVRNPGGFVKDPERQS